jgi:hypothetical protein
MLFPTYPFSSTCKKALSAMLFSWLCLSLLISQSCSASLSASFFFSAKNSSTEVSAVYSLPAAFMRGARVNPTKPELIF